MNDNICNDNINGSAAEARSVSDAKYLNRFLKYYFVNIFFSGIWMIMQIMRGSYIRIGVIYKNNSDCAIDNTEIAMFCLRCLKIIAFNQVFGHSVSLEMLLCYALMNLCSLRYH